MASKTGLKQWRCLRAPRMEKVTIMALNKSKDKANTPAAAAADQTENKAAAGGFEGMEGGDAAAAANAAPAADKAASTQSTPSTAATAETAPAATQEPSKSTAVANRSANSVSTAVKKAYQPALEDLRNVIDPAGMEFNTFTRVTVGLDGFEDDQKKDLGKEIKLELMSWNNRFVASPGTQDADAAEYVRYSLDGKTIEGTNDDIMDYVKQLKEVEGYKDAALKEYLTLYGFLTHANGKDIDMVDRSIVAVQVPPQSRALFTRYQIETGVKISQGVMEATPTLVLRQEKQQGKTTKFAIIRFSAK